MKFLALSTIFAITSNTTAFVPSLQSAITKSHASSTQSYMSAVEDAAELLRQARELREQAEADEMHLHKKLIDKMNQQDQETDAVIEEIFPANLPKGQAGVWKVAEILEKNRYSAPCLERVVERLHQREMTARGLEHVEPSLHHSHVKFERVADVNEDELQRIEGLIQVLIDAAGVLDEKVLTERHQNNTKTHHVDSTHWCSGHLKKTLDDKLHFIGREHEEQFKSRLEEFYEAARKKKHTKNDRNESTRMY